jgi:hypothetical protein
MIGTRHWDSARRSAGRLVVLLAALAGLFAMHGMSDHGTAGPGELSAATSAAHAPMDTSTKTGAHAHHDRGNESPSQPNHGHDLGVAGLCLAVLIAVLTLGVALGQQRYRALGARLSRAYASLLGFARERVPRPPDLFALSVQRC